ncbi:MAG TPA: hypothetical protein VEV44_16280 [Pseudoneobacillus sp.]|nr:hypothetical protein [Pseudoneobacillus sp.]
MVKVKKTNNIGRPSIGIKKHIALTLPEEYWDKLEVAKAMIGTEKNSEILRKIVIAALD